MRTWSLGAVGLACVIGLSLGAAYGEDGDYWLIATHRGAAHFLDAASIKTEASGVHSVSEWVLFNNTRGVTQINSLEVDCRQGMRARQTFRVQMEPAGDRQFLMRSIPAQRLGEEITQWRAPAEGDVRHSEIAFVCATEAERAANANWRHVGGNLDEARRVAFEERRPVERAPQAASERIERVTLARGEAVTLEIDIASGAVSLVRRGQADLSMWEQPARETVKNHPDAMGPNTAPMAAPRDQEPPPIEPGKVRVSFASIADGEHSLMLVENGYDQIFSYRAIMHVGRRSQPTDVCTVRLNYRTFEHWPHRIDRIELYELRLQPGDPDDAPVCR